MPDAPSPLHALAELVGIARHWRTVEGEDLTVADDRLAAILAAMGYETESAAQIRRSLAACLDQSRAFPAMIVTECGAWTPLPSKLNAADLTDETGQTRRLALEGGRLPPVSDPGYYTLTIGRRTVRLAVCPAQCPLPTTGRAWGATVQIPSLRGARPRPFGNFAALTETARLFGERGADALAINPVHALFPGNAADYSPYSPSSRQFLNTALGDPGLLGLPPLPDNSGADLIDWAEALPRHLSALRAVFDNLDAGKRTTFVRESGVDDAATRQHALFDALSCHFQNAHGIGWQSWPSAYHDPASPEVTAFATEHQDEVAFHLFAQGLARQGLATAQQAARASGMKLGLIADLAVGVHTGGSDSWRMPDAMLRGLTIGAPPDPLGPLGQNWSITGFSPTGLRQTGYAPWIAMLRAALMSSGGVRIDHAYGLARLWVIPEGGHSADGAYLAYPFDDLIRLATLEAHRANAIIIAENLGTSPPGFTQAITQRRMLGMRVLWFERAADHGFIGAQDYPSLSVALTGTHDTPTVAGWWKGRDIDWADMLGRLPETVTREEAESIRDWDRGLLWSTLSADHDRPAADDPARVVDAAISHIARSPAALALIPLEDLAACVEQPNLPGTVSEHPNWRRRMALPSSALLDEPAIATRIEALNRERGDPAPS